MQLLIKQKFFALGDTYNVTDTVGNAVFRIKSRLISPFAHKKYIKNARSGKTLMTLKRKFFAWGRTYIVKNASGEKKAKINQPPFHFRVNYNIDGYGNNLAVQGNFIGWDFTLFENGVPIGSVTKNLAFTDTYTLNINNPQDAPFFTTIVIAIDNMCHNGGH